MIRRLFRIGVWVGVLAGLAVWASRLYARRPLPPVERSAPLAPPTTPPAPAEPPPVWVEPIEGACPDSHPVKAKLTSKIFHVPGGASYQRTAPDRCYVDAAAAEADGLRAAKR